MRRGPGPWRHDDAGFRPGPPPPYGDGRMRRGDIRTAVLAVLAEGDGHGYDVIQRLEDKAGGRWRPSPGSVYPTLQLLEDEGLARSSERDGKRVYALTEAGRAAATDRLEGAGGPPWIRGGKEFGELRHAVGQIALAAKQVAMARSPEKVERATAILRNTRKQLYVILAED